MREIFRHGIVYGSSAATIAVLDLLSTPILTRLFDAAQYGTRELIMNTVAFIVPFTLIGFDFSFPADYVAQGERGRGRLFLSTSLIAVGSWAGALVLVVAVADLVVVHWPSNMAATAFSLATLSAAPGAILLVAKWALRFGFRPSTYAIIAVLAGLLSTGLGLVGAVSTRELVGLFAGQLIGISAAAAIGLATMRNDLSFRLDFEILQRAVRLGLPFVPATVLSLAFLYVDRQLIAALQGISAVGVYALGWRIAMVPTLLVVVLNTVWLPIALRDFRRPEAFRALLSDALRYACAVLGLISVTLTAAAPEIVGVLAPTQFAGAREVVGPLAFAVTFQAIAGLVGAGVFVARRPTLGLAANAAAFVSNATIGLALVPAWGGVGAALGVLVGYAVLAATYAVALRGMTPLRSLPLRDLAVILSAIALSLTVAASTEALGVRLVVPFAYAASLVLTRVFGRREYLEVRRLSSLAWRRFGS